MADTGKITVAGDFTFKQGGVLNIGISQSDIGKMVITGEATIEEGAIVNFSNFISNPSDVTFLTAGSFTDSTLPSSSIYTLRLSGTNLVVDGVASETVIDSAGTPNSSAAASLVNQVLLTEPASSELGQALVDYVNAVATLVSEGDPSADVAVRQLIGEEAVTAISAAAQNITQIGASLGGRLAALHNAFAANSPITPAAGYGAALNRLWVAPFGSFADQHNIEGLYGFEYKVGGVSLGYDREVAAVPGLTLGLTASWSKGTLDNNDGLSSFSIETFSLGTYASYEFGNGLYLDGNIGFGFTDNDGDTVLVVGGRKSSSFNSKSFQAGLELGYFASLSPNLSLIPSVGLRYVNIRQDSWQDRIIADPNNLVVANWFSDSTINYLEIPVNLKLQGSFQTGGGVVITPEIKVGGVFVANKPSRDVRMGFVGSSQSTVVRGVDSGKHRFAAGAGIKVQATDTVDFFVNYDFEKRSGYSSHSGSLGLGFSF